MIITAIVVVLECDTIDYECKLWIIISVINGGERSQRLGTSIR